MFKNILFLIFTFVSLSGYSQKFNFTKHSVETGLSGSNIHDIIEDQFGRIWFATENGGVTIYDGVSYEHLNINNHLPTNIVYDLLEDSKGNIWIGTKEGLVKYDGRQYTVFNYEDGISSNVIKCLFEDSLGNIWIGTERGRICMFNGTIFLNYNQKQNFAGETVRSIAENEDGLLIGTEKGLLKWDGNTFSKIEKYPGFGFSSVTSILIQDQKTWIGTLTGLHLLDNGKIIDYSLIYPFPSNIITSLEVDKQNRLWVGTAGSGIVRINEEGLIENITSKNGLPSNYVLSITVDNNQNIWIGTLSGGATKFGGDAFTYYTDDVCLKSNFVYSLLEDKTGDVWIGTGDGITIYHDNSFLQINKEDGLPDNQINALIQDESGLVWAGTYNGVSILEDHKIVQNVGKQEGITKPVISLFEDSNKNIWIGTHGQGVFKWNGVQLMNFDAKSGLSNEIIFTINEDRNGRILLGTYGGGVNIIDEDEISIINTSNGLPSNIVKSIGKDIYENIWLGTEKGLVKLGDKIEIFDVNNGLTSSSIEAILFDNKYTLWIGSGKGIDRLYLNPPQIQREKGKLFNSIKRFNSKNGLIGGQIKTGAGMLTNNGCVWFGTVGGAIQYNTSAEENREYFEPRTYLKKIKINFEEMDWLAKNHSTNRFWNTPENLVLDYNENHISFDFIGIDLNSPKQVKYKWMLEGFDEDYSPYSKNHTVTYPQLPPGNYTLKIIACSNEEECNEIPLEYTFEINPPFWKTVWFIVLASILVLTSIITAIKHRENRLKEENEHLESVIKERTKEIVQKNQEMTNAHDEILHKNSIIETKNEEFNSSVRYAETIQRALLPKESTLKNTFPESFILFKPRDLVSGDFYWYKKFNNTFVIAVVDCTGHGVPGAFMSMIGMTLINGIAGSDKVPSPDIALEMIDKEIKVAFEDSDVENKDGMDLALVAIHVDDNIIQYCGAQRPLFIIRDGKLIEYKANKVSIGGYYEGTKNFEYHDILFKSGDCIYLFSDGYQDQFGGPKDKKFMIKKLKKILLDNAHLPMEKQKAILDENLTTWQGSGEQTDDILMMGIKL